ncbi:MAG: hypothetical protein DMF79_19265, partial [Acidobacteria bacterium]
IASLAIPTSIIATFTLLKAMDFTLNNMTLLALTLAVGIVIDDAIVVLENIVRYLEEKGYEPRAAAIDATREITLAVLATTLSLVIIFLPIAFMSGYARRYVNQFGWTMAFAILVSMLVSFTLTPMLSSRLLKSASPGKEGHAVKEWPFFAGIDRGYGRVLRWSLDHRRLVMGLAMATFLLAVPLNLLVGRDWIPPDDQGELSVLLNLPEGSSLEATARVSTEIANRIAALKGVAFVNPYVHEGAITSHSHIYVKLVDLDKRSFSNLDAAAAARKVCAAFPNVRTKIMIPSALGGGELFFPIRALILGPDFDRVAALSKDAAARIRKIPGLLDVDTMLSLNSPELEVRIDRPRASDLGVRAADVGGAVRLMLAGEDQISTYKEGDEQYDVTLQLLPEQQKNPDLFARLMIPSTKVGQVRLDNVATIERGLGPARIERYNRQFQASVIGNNAPDFPLDAAARAVGEEIRRTGLPAGYAFRFTGSVKILDETTRNLIIAFLLASIFMYMVLAAQFDSFLHPFDTMLSLNSPELEVRIDRPRASDLGVRAADVGGAVRLMLAGEDQISTYKEGDEQYDVTLQLLPEQQKNPDLFARLMIPSTKVGQVRLDNVATIERGLGPARIERYNRQFQASVIGNNAPDFPLDAAARAVGEEIRRTGLPAGYAFRFTGSVKILDETTRNLIIAFLLASIFMYMVLAAQFDSFLHPFTIMLSLPLAIPFALFSLWITGRTLNLWSSLGVLLLLGIVKKNGILQVDYTNKLREEGLPLREAILQANHVRLRPILMTTLSIVAGLLPTAIGLGAGSAQRSAVAVTIIGGQTLCLLPTLLVTPVAYSLFAEAEARGFRAHLAPLLARVRSSLPTALRRS